MSKEWELICRHPGGHKFFTHVPSGRIGVADNSGRTPDQTEDGILWLNKNRPVQVGLEDCTFSVTKESDGGTYKVLDPLVAGLQACEDLSLEIAVSGPMRRAVTIITSMSVGGRARPA